MHVPGIVARYLLFFVLAMGAGMSAVAILDGIVRTSLTGTSPLQSTPSGPWAIGLFVVAFWGPILVVPAWFATRPLRRELRRACSARRDLDENHACVATLRDARYAVVVDARAGERLLFELGPMRLLLLDGDRLRHDYALFGLPEPVDEDEDGDDADPGDDEHEIATPELASLPFPTDDFTLEWLPRSGRLLRVESRGAITRPTRVLLDNELPLPEGKSLTKEPERDVQPVDGDFDALLARARVPA